MGIFVGGAGLEEVSETKGMGIISKPGVKLAVPRHCDN